MTTVEPLLFKLQCCGVEHPLKVGRLSHVVTDGLEKAKRAMRAMRINEGKDSCVRSPEKWVTGDG